MKHFACCFTANFIIMKHSIVYQMEISNFKGNLFNKTSMNIHPVNEWNLMMKYLNWISAKSLMSCLSQYQTLLVKRDMLKHVIMFDHWVK